MTVHLIKLCVGIETIDELANWQASGRANWPRGSQDPDAPLAHITRHTPKRAEELLAGGSIYWVIKGRVRARQKLVGFERIEDAEGKSHCALVMSRLLYETRLLKHRPFQGWRYMAVEKAPRDVGRFKAEAGEGAESLKAELEALGLL